MTDYLESLPDFDFSDRQAELDEESRTEASRTEVEDLLSIKDRSQRREAIFFHLKGPWKAHKQFLKDTREYNDRVAASYDGKPLIDRGSHRTYFSPKELDKFRKPKG